jgi:23S rRNA pseudouridine1911/1915/1917 synthase
MEDCLEKIKVVFEDENILAVNKPSGLSVHEDGRSDEKVLTDWIRSKYPEINGVGEEMRLQNGLTIDRPGIVHRLDRDTSGILLIAKNQKTFLFLKKQFQNREIQKEYRAFLYGELTNFNGTINKTIGRSKKDFRLWTAGPNKKGKLREAITRWTKIVSGGGFSYVIFEPKTGRTHQLRVHAKSIGHPIICDKRYAPKKKCELGFDRLALHAHAISFSNISGERVFLEADLPNDFLSAEKTIKES